MSHVLLLEGGDGGSESPPPRDGLWWRGIWLQEVG